MSSEDDNSPEDIAERIRDSFADEYQDYDLDDIESLVERFQRMGLGNNDDELRRAVITSVAEDEGVDRGTLLGVSGEGGGGDGSADSVGVQAVKELGDEQWVSMENVKAVQLDEHESDSIIQTGRLGDEDGTVRFVAWSASFEEPPLEEGKVYNLDPVVTDEYEGRISINLNKTTEIEEVDDVDFEVGEDTDAVEGCLVSINRDRSGLILRDAETGEYVSSDEGDTEHDLRLMGVLDDGTSAQDVVIGRGLTEELTGITEDEATEMAMEHLDRSVVADAMAERVLGRYYRIEGVKIGRYLNADSVEMLDEAPEFDEELLIEARSMGQ